MILRVRRHGAGPTLTLPPSVSVAEAREFLTNQEVWLRERIEDASPGAPIRDGITLPFRGRVVTVRMKSGGPHGLEGAVLCVPGPSVRLSHQVSAFLREAAREACVDAAYQHAARLGRRIGRITMRDTRSRWGSCTSSGDLMFSWRLILAPEAVLDYVVAHEVAHLVEMNHSAAFWKVVRHLCRQYEEPRSWLRLHGTELLAIDFSGGA